MDIILALVVVAATSAALAYFLWRSWVSESQSHQGAANLLGKKARVTPVSERYHSVSVKPMEGACDAVKALSDHRYLVAAAPMLPLSDCRNPRCDCRYVHHQDRREPGSDRRQSTELPPETRLLRGSGNRRTKRGRRREDLAVA